MNEQLALNVIQEAIQCGVTEFCVCAGNRMAPLYKLLSNAPSLKKYYWPEERSAAFFALGRSRATGAPVAVIVTSGTAAGELLPAAMEAYHTGVPLLLITTDRPRRYRGSNAPQSTDQLNLFGVFTPFKQDVAAEEKCDLSSWECQTPAHLNVCFEEPFPKRDAAGNAIPEKSSVLVVHSTSSPQKSKPIDARGFSWLDQFLENTHFPFVVVSALKSTARESVAQFLLKLNAPVLFEGVSGLREDPRLQHLRISRTEAILVQSEKRKYPIDGVLRIGGIPTFRTWRDIEELNGKIKVCSVSEVPFSGISWADVIHTSIQHFFNNYPLSRQYNLDLSDEWRIADQQHQCSLQDLFNEEPTSEPSLIHHLSQKIQRDSMVYLGNGLPIREWDAAACNKSQNIDVCASRGLSGIDGQISTFLGLSSSHRPNWAIIGDLTALYDMTAPWILPQINDRQINIVVVNNRGGQLFSKFLPEPNFINEHNLKFSPLAEMWGLHYAKWELIPKEITSQGNQLIEIYPDNSATARFNKKVATL